MSMITNKVFPYVKEASITITYYRESYMEYSITKNYHVILHEARTSWVISASSVSITSISLYHEVSSNQ